MPKVTWNYVGRGGYGFGYSIAAVELKRTARRVKIAVYNLGIKQVQYKTVHPEKITSRKSHSVPLDDLVNDETVAVTA